MHGTKQQASVIEALAKLLRRHNGLSSWDSHHGEDDGGIRGSQLLAP